MQGVVISLIIPVYNVAPYLRKCLNSLLEQTFDCWEAILINDGSTDQSGQICEEFASKDSRFHVFHKPNGGVSSARNVGIENASGEWIWFVDSDDWISSDACEKLHDVICRINCDLVLFGIRYFDESYKEVGYERRDNICGKSKEQTITISDYPPQNYLIKTELVRDNHLRFSEGIAVGEDLEFQYKYLMICNRPLSIDSILYMCLRRDGSAMRNPKTIQNQATDSPRVLNNLILFIESHEIKESLWLSSRLTRTFKSCMSANYCAHRSTTTLQQLLRDYDKRLKALGFKQYRDTAVRVGLYDLRLYNLVQKLRKLLKG